MIRDYLKKERPWYANVPKNYLAQIVAADTTNFVTVLTAPADGLLVDTLQVSNDDTVARTIQFGINKGSGAIAIGQPISVTNAAQFDFLDGVRIVGLPINNQGKRFIRLEAGEILVARAGATVAANQVRIFASGVQFEPEA